jgi:hypothetical protein
VYNVFLFLLCFFVFFDKLIYCSVSFVADGSSKPGGASNQQQGDQGQSGGQWVDAPSSVDRKISRRFNWYKRNQIKKEAYSEYGKISEVCSGIENNIKIFFDKKSEVKSSMDNSKSIIDGMIVRFYGKLAGLSELTSVFKTSISVLRKLEKSQIIADDKDFMDEIVRIGKMIDDSILKIQNLDENIDIVKKMGSSLESGCSTLSNLEFRINKYDEESWSEYQKLDELIGDKQANEILSKIKNYLRNVKAIDSYIRGDFIDFFNSTIDNIMSSEVALQDFFTDWIKEHREIKINVSKLRSLEKKKIVEKLQEEEYTMKKKYEDDIRKEAERAAYIFSQRSWHIKFYEYIHPKIVSAKNTVVSFLSQLINKSISFVNSIFGSKASSDKSIKAKGNVSITEKKDTTRKNKLTVSDPDEIQALSKKKHASDKDDLSKEKEFLKTLKKQESPEEKLSKKSSQKKKNKKSSAKIKDKKTTPYIDVKTTDKGIDISISPQQIKSNNKQKVIKPVAAGDIQSSDKAQSSVQSPATGDSSDVGASRGNDGPQGQNVSSGGSDESQSLQAEEPDVSSENALPTTENIEQAEPDSTNATGDDASTQATSAEPFKQEYSDGSVDGEPAKQEDEDKSEYQAVDTSLVPSPDDMISAISSDQGEANQAVHRMTEESHFAYSKTGGGTGGSANQGGYDTGGYDTGGYDTGGYDTGGYDTGGDDDYDDYDDE